MRALTYDMMHKEIEIYVDNMIAKPVVEEDHLADLKNVFKWLKKYELKLNLSKRVWGATSSNLLGFIVSLRGI